MSLRTARSKRRTSWGADAMLVKIVTVVATVVVIGVVFYPFVAPMLARAWQPHDRTHFCDRCTRGYHDATMLAWHRAAMHPELAIEILDDGDTVGPAQPLRAAAIPDIAPEPASATSPVVEIRSGDRVYRVISGGKK